MNTLVLRGPVNVSFLLPLHDSFLSGDWAFLLDEVLGLWWEATPGPCGAAIPTDAAQLSCCSSCPLSVGPVLGLHAYPVLFTYDE